MSAVIILLAVLCFAGGFALSWFQMRKRIQRRYQERLVEEVHKRVAEEVLKRATGTSGRPPPGKPQP